MTKKKILLVENDPVSAQQIQGQLRELGYTPVGLAAVGDESIVLAGELQPDLVLMDLQLSGAVDGIDIARAICERFFLPVVFITALADEETISRAKLIEPSGFIMKPFSERELRAVLELAFCKHEAEARLRASEQRFRSIFDAWPKCVKLMSPDGELLEMNRAGLHMLEADSVEDVRAYGIDNFVDSAYRPAFHALHEHVLGGVEGVLEFPATGMRGTKRWLETTVTPMRDAVGRVTMMLATTRDISERKVTEAALHLSALSLKAISQGVIIAGTDHRILSVNEAFEAMSGYASEEVLGKKWRLLEGPLTNPRTVAEMRLALEEGHPFAGEILNYRKDGTVFWNELSISPVRDAQGKPTHFIGITSDVTKRKHSEIALRESNRQLQAISQRVLEAQETERRRVAHELHDELGQALTAIKINLQASDRFQGQSLKELNAENIRIIEEALQHVRSLALALRPSMLDDLGLLPALRWIADQTAARSGFSVKVLDASPAIRLPPSVETACFRIVQEALTNIARHSQARAVEIKLHHDKDALVLSVHDNGCGFDVKSMREQARAGGSIGMLGMQERAVLLGGSLEINSSPGQGSVLRLRCPLSPLEEHP